MAEISHLFLFLVLKINIFIILHINCLFHKRLKIFNKNQDNGLKWAIFRPFFSICMKNRHRK